MADLFEQLQSLLAPHYQLERELGRGGMATVYLARDLRHDRPVALKVLHPELAATLGPERFQREIRMAARLQHPHILSVHDSGEITEGPDGRPRALPLLWFTMPYVEGESLRDRLNRDRQLPVEEAVQIAREVAEALDYAHRHGVIHRDIKPENILLTENHPLVADFGIARALGGGSGDRLTETGMAVGTPAYMSPEQASGGRDVDARTDIYALGCVLYEMLAGEAPFTGPTPQAIMARRFTEEAPSVRRSRPMAPDAVEQAVHRALAAVPADRYPTAADFARALSPAAAISGTTPTVAAALPVRSTGARLLVKRPLFAVLMLGFAIGGGSLFAWKRMRGPDEGLGPRRIAVLPFENLGPADQDYFADGITDEVRGKLTGLPGLEVMARGSSNQYRKTTKTPQQVGQELGVQYLLTGTVRWEPGSNNTGRVKVSPELIQVANGSAKWQQPFDAPLTDVFQVQTDIAGRVAQALNVALGDSARHQLAQRPTSNEEAYGYYLKGRSYEERARLNVEPQTMVIAQQMYEKAIGLDSGFALAWVRLSEVHQYFYGRDPTDASRRAKAKEASDRALALAPALAEAHAAAGDYLRSIVRDREQASAEYAQALRLDPNNAELLSNLAWDQVYRGQRDSALATMAKAAALDPRSAEQALSHADLVSSELRFAEADSLFDRALTLAPDQYHAYWDKAQNLIDWKGDVEGARRVMRQAEERIGKVEFVKKMCVACFDWPGPLAADYEHVLDELTLDGFTARDSINYYVARAERARAHQRADLEHKYWDTARVIAERLLRARPDQARVYDVLADIYAGLGRRADVERAHRRYEELARLNYGSAYLPSEIASHWAALHHRFGDTDAAIDSLGSALSDSLSFWVSVPRLRVDPFWASLRNNPKFQALLARR